ncbi:MAG: hypothetical protein IKI91_02245 [Clostridia bacterium]|nr:hypothetical protein [Clostridia bacterium]
MAQGKIWNPKLFFEGLKQLRLIGFLSLIVMSVEAVLVPVSRAMNNAKYSVGVEVMDGFHAHPFLLLTFTIIAPLMTLSLFSFLNKRNASDFYHSLPYTRACLFLSYASAVLLWIVAVAAISSALSILTFLIFQSRLALIVPSLMKLTLGCSVASMLVASSVMLAMTVTGTTFTNIIVSGLIIFLPRFAILMLTGVLGDVLPILDMSSLTFPLDSSLNLVAGTVIGVFVSRAGMTGTMNILLTGSSQIYSAVLAAIYLTLACVLFCRRKSESAERSAPNRTLQALFRITLTMVICIPVCAAIFSESVGGGPGNNAFVYVVYYIVAAGVYFTYELITSKQISRAVKSLPGLLIVAAVNLCLIFGMRGIYKAELGFTPSADEIKSVSLAGVDVTSRYDINMYDYAILKNSSMEYDDPEMREIVSRALAESCRQLREGGVDGFVVKNLSGSTQGFRIRTSSGVRSRILPLPEDDYMTIQSKFTGSKSFSEALTDLPDPLKNTLDWGEMKLTKDESDLLFGMLKKEIAQADPEEWMNAVGGSVPTLSWVRYVTSVGKESPTLTVPLCPEFAPETCRKYLAITAEKSNIKPDELTDLLRKSEEEGQQTLSGSVFLESFTVYVCGKDGKLTSYYWYPDGLVTSDEIGEILSGALEIRAPAAGESFITASFNCFNAGNQREYKTIAGTLRDDAAEKIADLLRESGE